MFRLENDRALIGAFRPRDRRVIEMPSGLKFPLFVRDYLAWTETSGARVYLVFGAPGTRKPIGIIFRRDTSEGIPLSHMCDWCQYSGTSLDVGLLTVDVNSRRRVGVHLCVDLKCKDRLEDTAERTGRHSLPMLTQLGEKMFRFAHEALGVDAEPEGKNAQEPAG